MRAFQIEDIRLFMQQLLCTGTFDTFETVRLNVRSFASFSIEGQPSSEWSDSGQDDDEASHRYIQWKMLRPILCSILHGKRKPSSIQIVFRLADYNCQKILEQSGIPLSLQDIDGLYLNITYTHTSSAETLQCTTGTSLRIFVMDKALEHAWDDMVCRLFRSRQLPF